MRTLIRLLGSTFAALAIIFVFLSASTIVSAQGLDTPDTTAEYKCTDNQSTQACVDNNPIVKWLQFFINVLSVVILAGSAVMVAVAGVQYTTSRDNPQAVQAAKQKMYNIALGLGIYFFLYAFVQWLVPGGVF